METNGQDIVFLQAIDKSERSTSHSVRKEARTREAIEAIVSINTAISKLERLTPTGGRNSVGARAVFSNLRQQTSLLQSYYLGDEAKAAKPRNSGHPHHFNSAKRRLPQSYTPLDDKKIVNFICKNNYYKEANSPKNRMWQRVAKEVELDRPHTPAALAWHYREVLRPNLSKLVTPCELNKFPEMTQAQLDNIARRQDDKSIYL